MQSCMIYPAHPTATINTSACRVMSGSWCAWNPRESSSEAGDAAGEDSVPLGGAAGLGGASAGGSEEPASLCGEEGPGSRGRQAAAARRMDSTLDWSSRHLRQKGLGYFSPYPRSSLLAATHPHHTPQPTLGSSACGIW
jgi:hypothetical protein